MHKAALVLVGWMVAAMVGIGGSVAWGWPFWAVGLIGLGLTGAAVVMTRSLWDQTNTHQEEVLTGIRQLQQLTGTTATYMPVAVEPETVGIQIQRLAAEIHRRMINLEEERTKIIAIMENLVEGVVAFDPKGKALFTNPSARRILGLEAKDIQGKSVWELIRNQELASGNVPASGLA